MSVNLEINGSTVPYPETGDTNWGDQATEAMQSMANPANTVYKNTIKANLTSTGDTDVLAASQGKVLKDVQDTQQTSIDLNNTHRTSDGKNHSDVVLNNTHRASDGKDHSDVVLNNAHRISDGTDHSDVVTNTSNISTNTTNISKNALVGEIKAYAGSTAPTAHLICNAETIGDVGSGATNESADYETLFDLLKSSWGNAGTEVWANGDTVKLPDLRGMFLRGTGTHGSLTMEDTNAYAGPAVGASENDQFMSHYHDQQVNISYGTVSNASVVGGNNIGSRADASEVTVKGPTSDGTQGTRNGDETRPVNYGVTYIIRY